MLVIVGGRQDSVCRALVARWAGIRVGLLTPQDLSVVGWQRHLSLADGSRAVVGGMVVAEAEITGVLTRLPYVLDRDLTNITPEDRSFVAAEMTGFLFFWLSQLQCPVLNRPTPTCLSGPYLHQEQWAHLAAQLGIPTRPVLRRAVLGESGPAKQPASEAITATVIIVGDRWFGEVDQALASQARCLAKAAGIDLLAVRFSSAEYGARFVDAEVSPDLSDEEVADAVLEYLKGPRT